MMIERNSNKSNAVAGNVLLARIVEQPPPAPQGALAEDGSDRTVTVIFTVEQDGDQEALGAIVLKELTRYLADTEKPGEPIISWCIPPAASPQRETGEQRDFRFAVAVRSAIRAHEHALCPCRVPNVINDAHVSIYGVPCAATAKDPR